MKETTEYNLGQELNRARAKFPKPDGLVIALMEEVGELAQAVNKSKYEGGGFFEIYEEAIHVASTAIRIAEEGDPTATEYKFLHEFYQRYGESKGGAE